MFTKALREHKEPLRPIASGQLRLNAAPIAPTAPMNQIQGEKRKFDAPASSRDSLASLHNEVYFDENDFDDDADFDFSGPLLPPPPSCTSSKQSEGHANKTTTTSPPTEQNSVLLEGAPASSAPLQWSSSPVQHLQPPKGRILPWARSHSTPASAPNNPTGDPFQTPVAKPPSYPWNKTLSAVKEEQKELRKQQRFRSSNEKQASKIFKSIPKVASIFLSDEQRNVLEMIVKKGQSVFFTGSAGTGKSVLMREAIRQLRDKYKNEPDRVAVTASTGLAACNISGVTLHSFAGVGLGKEDAAGLLKKVS